MGLSLHIQESFSDFKISCDEIGANQVSQANLSCQDP